MLKRFEDPGSKLKAQKCSFGKTKVTFRGLISFYWKFITDFASKVAPLHKLWRKRAEFTSDSNCESAFKTFKEVLTRYSLLRYPDFLLLYFLYIDACDIDIGTVLAQSGFDGEWIIAYARMSLQPKLAELCCDGKGSVCYCVWCEILQTLSIWPNIHCDNWP